MVPCSDNEVPVGCPAEEHAFSDQITCLGSAHQRTGVGFGDLNQRVPKASAAR